MKKASKNFLYNAIYQIFTFLIPLITTPYISRILGVDNIGVYSFTFSIVTYFALAVMLGINNYGSREIAKVANDKKSLSKKFFSIYSIQAINAIALLLIFTITCLTINYDHKEILWIQMIYLLSCLFDINWLFFGLEKFKITVLRNALVKIISLVSIFIFVKAETDLWIYTLIISLSTLISQLYLLLAARKEITWTKVSFREIYSNLKPCLVLFIPVIAYSIYRIMDKTMIGIFSDNTNLGNYESAEKIINIPVSLITALGTVMLPHMSKSNDSEFSAKIKDTYKLCFFTILPICAGLTATSKDFCNVFFGPEYTMTPNIILLLLPTVLFSCITNITRNNYLIPKSKDSIYVSSTLIGAAINLVFNLIFIPLYGAYGACIGTIAAEGSIMIYQVIKTRHNIEYRQNLLAITPFIAKSIVMGIAVFLSGLLVKEETMRVIVQAIVGVVVYVLMNSKYIMHEFIKKKK